MSWRHRPDMTESEVTRAMDLASQAVGGMAVPIVGGLMQRAGLPDRRYEHLLWSGWVEWKRDTGELSGLQRKFLRDCIRMRSPALSVWTMRSGAVIARSPLTGVTLGFNVGWSLKDKLEPRQVGQCLLGMLQVAWEQQIVEADARCVPGCFQKAFSGESGPCGGVQAPGALPKGYPRA